MSCEGETMIIGFSGTRHGMNDVQRALFEGLIKEPTEFHHGSCRGSDIQAARIVRSLFRNHIPIICHPGPDGDGNREDSGVDDEKRPPRSHLARNRDIVNACDLLIACPFENEEQARGGTWYTINFAKKTGKKVTIIFPDGGVE